jgi:type IV secretory pathway protease TraF
MSDYEAASFDSRYFGPLDRVGVLRAMRPVLTWP